MVDHYVDFDESQRAAWHAMPVVELEMKSTVECIMEVLGDPKFWELDSRNTISDIDVVEEGVCRYTVTRWFLAGITHSFRYIRHTSGKLGLISIHLKVWTTQRIIGRQVVCNCYEENKAAMVWIRFTVEPLALDDDGNPITRIRIEERASNSKFLLFLGKGKIRKVRVYLLEQLKLRCESLRHRNTVSAADNPVIPHVNEPAVVVPPPAVHVEPVEPLMNFPEPPVQVAPADGDGSDNDDDEGMCCVCWENPIEVAFLPCGHLCVCQTCAENGMEECPMCRSAIVSSSRIFKSGV